jgi:hypothetical protein
MMPTILRCVLLPLAAVTLAGTAVPAAGQVRLSGSTVSGRVLDSGTSRPVANAVVVLEPVGGGLMRDPASGLTAARTVVTGESGGYRFADLVPGGYRLRIERLGYRAATVELEVGRPVDAAVSVALELDPVVLEPMRAEQRSSSWFQRAANVRDEPDLARISAERERQAQFLSSDTRALTYADVMDGVTLGEGDVFRALQRFTGVVTRDDYTAELWTRGAPWTQTRVTFDGVPLFNPVHAVGVLSAITPEILGAVIFHPGVRPVSMGEGAAGVVDLQSRAGGGDGSVRGVADVSVASAKLVLDQRINERAAWIVAARRSHLDVLTGGLDRIGLDTLDLPFGFHDVAARADIAVGGARIEASGLHEKDRLHGDVDGVLERTRARWGNDAGRVTLRTAWSGLELSQTVGASRYRALTEEHEVRTRAASPAWSEPETSNEIDHVHVAGDVTQSRRQDGAHWALGYEIARQRIRYDGPFPRYYAVKPDTLLRLDYARDLTVGAVWGTMRRSVGARIAIDPGVRIEASRALGNSGILRVSPRVSLRVKLTDAQTASLSAGRTWQHAQSIGLAGPSVHPAFHASHFWIWADARRPAIRADVVNLGTERWLGSGWLVSANAWARASSGIATPDPTPGRLGRRVLFVAADGSARGLELGVRRIGARWSAAAGYTLSRSQLVMGDAVYPGPADRRHVIDMMAAARVWSGLRLSAAFTSMSGAPFTRAYSRSPEDCTAFGFGCDNPTGSWVESYHAERTPSYRSLDMSVQWTSTVRGATVSAYAQVRNVLGRDNASTYAGSAPIARVTTPEGTTFRFDDRFESGLRRLPLVGLRLSF